MSRKMLQNFSYDIRFYEHSTSVNVLNLLKINVHRAKRPCAYHEHSDQPAQMHKVVSVLNFHFKDLTGFVDGICRQGNL